MSGEAASCCCGSVSIDQLCGIGHLQAFILFACIFVHENLSALRRMGVRTATFHAGNPVLLARSFVKEVARNTTALGALQRPPAVVDASPGLRKRNPANAT